MIAPPDTSFPAQLERVAARLDLIAPRLAARESPEAAQTLAAVRAELQTFADLAAAAQERPLRPVPVLGAHAWGDQLRVLGHDVSEASGQQPGVVVVGSEVLAALAARL